MMVYKILSYNWFGAQEIYLKIRGSWWHCLMFYHGLRFELIFLTSIGYTLVYEAS